MNDYVTITAGVSLPQPAIQAALSGPLTDILTSLIQSMLDGGELVIRDGVVTTPDERYLVVLPTEARVDSL